MNQFTKEEIKDYLFRNRVILDGNCWTLSTRKGKGYQYYEGHGIHRLSMWAFGDFDLNSKNKILHKCDNPPCWNPDHLSEGTQSDNRMDTIAKGRSPRLFGNNATKKTHCKHGHEFTPENTRNNGGKRQCITCVKERDKNRV